MTPRYSARELSDLLRSRLDQWSYEENNARFSHDFPESARFNRVRYPMIKRDKIVDPLSLTSPPPCSPSVIGGENEDRKVKTLIDWRTSRRRCNCQCERPMQSRCPSTINSRSRRLLFAGGRLSAGKKPIGSGQQCVSRLVPRSASTMR